MFICVNSWLEICGSANNFVPESFCLSPRSLRLSTLNRGLSRKNSQLFRTDKPSQIVANQHLLKLVKARQRFSPYPRQAFALGHSSQRHKEMDSTICSIGGDSDHCQSPVQPFRKQRREEVVPIICSIVWPPVPVPFSLLSLRASHVKRPGLLFLPPVKKSTFIKEIPAPFLKKLCNQITINKE